MKKLGLTILTSIMMVFGALAQDSLYVSGTMINLQGAVVDIEITLSDGQSTTVTTNGDGTFEAEFETNTFISNVTATYVDCAGNVVVVTIQSTFIGWIFELDYCPGTGGGDIYGCTDPEALNYNPEATVDDGSCEYDDCDCTGTEYDPVCAIVNTPIFGADTLTFSNECLALCADAIVIYDGTCENTPDIWGCTDPDALNYDSEALIDDGSCIYDNGGGDSTLCEAAFIIVPDSSGNAAGDVLWVVNTSTGENLEYLWDFGNGDTSTEQFPTYVYEDDGPYNLCLTVTSASFGGVLCTSMYCDSVGGYLFPGFAGNGNEGIVAEGFTINVVESVPSGIEDFESLSGLNVFPNPVSESAQITLWSEVGQSARVQLYSLEGRLLMEEQFNLQSGNNLHQLGLEEIPDGMFILQITGSSGSVQQRIIKR